MSDRNGLSGPAATVEIVLQHRGFLMGLAYRMLGSWQDAEDLTQDVFVRWLDRASAEVREPRAWLCKSLVRLCLDHLKSARVRREEYVGPWLPEPIVTDQDAFRIIESRAQLSTAFLHLLERLSPLERAAFLLKETFDVSYSELSEILDRQETACRQLVHRARRRLGEGARFEPSAEEHARLLGEFLRAAREGNPQRLEELLTQDVALYSDGGGKVPHARKVVRGPTAIAQFILGIRKKYGAPRLQFGEINGQPGLTGYLGEQLSLVLTLQIIDEKIASMYFVLNPEKLTHLQPGKWTPGRERSVEDLR